MANDREVQTITKGDVSGVDPTMLQGGALVDLSGAAPARFFDEEAFADYSKSGFLGRLQLCGGNSELVKEEKVSIANYIYTTTKDDFKVLGKQVDLIPLALRLVAVKIGGEQVASYYDPNSAEFKAVVVESEQPDSKCMYGPQFLCWVPVISEFATFLFGTKSSRKEARNMRPLIGKGASLNSRLIKTAKYSWHTPRVLVCNANLTAPPRERMLSMIETFNNPEASSVEFNPEEMERQQNQAESEPEADARPQTTGKRKR